MDTDAHDLLAVNVRRLTEAAGISPAELADTLGISRTRLFEILSGEFDPDLDLIRRMAAILGVSMAELFVELRDLPLGTIKH